MEALALIQSLISDPKALESYRRNPQIYLREHGYPAELQQQLDQLAVSPIQEISTVIKLTVPPGPGLGEVAEAVSGTVKQLDGFVTLSTPNQVFLAEVTTSAGVVSRLLPHSYLVYDPVTEKLSFRLSISYIDPSDTDDEVATLIVAYGEPLSEAPYNLGDTNIRLEVDKYTLLKRFEPLQRALESPSTYDPTTNTLSLTIGDQANLERTIG